MEPYGQTKPANNNYRNLIGPWPTTREIGKRLKSIHYFTGLRCVNGHVAPRVTKSGCCIDCATDWRLKNRAKIAVEYKVWAKENEEHLKAYNDNWRKENLEHVRTESRRRAVGYRERHREKYNLRALEYFHRKMQEPKFRQQRSIHASIQYGKRKASEGSYTKEDIDEILRLQKYKCAECGVSVRGKKKRHIDHRIPIKLGGSNWPSNLQILCAPCNLSKGAKHPIEFAQSKGRLL